MLEHDETLRLIKEAQNGSESAKSTLLENNYPLIKSVIKRFRNKGVEYEDLYQLGCVGFLKAIKNFNEDYNVKFSTYIVPMVAGEVKRFMRDDGAVKVSRALKGLYYNITKLMTDYKQKNNGQSPTIEYLAKQLNIDEQEIVMAMESSRSLISLNEKFDEDDSQGILKLIQDEWPLVGYFIGGADFTGHTPLNIASAMADELRAYMARFIWRRVGWSVLFVVVAAVVVIQTMEQTGRARRTASSRARSTGGSRRRGARPKRYDDF